MQQKKTSILIDAHIFDKEPQGTATYIKGLYNAFFKSYSNVYELYAAADDVSNLQRVFPEFKKQNLLHLPKTNSLKRLYKTLPALITEYDIDFAHFQQIAPLKKNCKYIVTIHDVLFNDFKDQFSFFYRLSRNYLFKKALALSDIKLTVSDYSKQAIEKFYHTKNIYVTHNAVSEKFFNEYDKDAATNYVKEKFKAENYILYVSRIEKRKNHISLLNAYCDMRLYEAGTQLVFIGRNDLPVKALTDRIAALSAQEKEHFFWFEDVNDKDIFELYKAATMFVYPSLAEGFGIPPIEAAALKINTLCSNTTAMSDFSFFEENLFDPYNINELQNKIQYNIKHPPLPSVLTERSNVVKQKYNWHNAASLLHDLIQNELLIN